MAEPGLQAFTARSWCALACQIGNALRPGYEVIAQAGIVPPERADSWYQADLAVTCAGVTGRQFITKPILIVEVLSPSTAATDRDRKLPDYCTIPSLQDILAVSSSERRMEHFRREPDGWKIQDLRGAGTLHLQGARGHARPGRALHGNSGPDAPRLRRPLTLTCGSGPASAGWSGGWCRVWRGE